MTDGKYYTDNACNVNVIRTCTYTCTCTCACTSAETLVHTVRVHTEDQFSTSAYSSINTVHMASIQCHSLAPNARAATCVKLSQNSTHSTCMVSYDWSVARSISELLVYPCNCH